MIIYNYSLPPFFKIYNMNVYHYIAENNPDAANEVCKKYGYYQITSIDELANTLQSIVAEDGEQSLQEVMSLHPDKDVIIELFDKKKEEAPTPTPPQPIVSLGADGSKDCSCVKSSADGTTTTTNSGMVSQTNLMILAGALIISISIISLIKSKS